jgi:16S rRNA (adenine1518-N6/adenine1519-N6)-dimethyltransferase
MSLLEKTKLLLRSHRSLPKKSFGQNFIIDRSIYESMINYAALDKDDIVLDIGAGLGFLSRFAAERCKKVLAVEADQQVVPILREQLTDINNVEILMGDVFKTTIPDFNKILSAPPYNISSDLILWILQHSFARGVLVFQKEFANRLVACVGTEEYGWLTVYTQCRTDVELLEEVSKTAFYPQPKVDSTIIRLVLKTQQPCLKLSDVAFRRFLQTLFTHRNRKIRGAVLPYLRDVRGLSKREAEGVLEKFPYLEKRVRELAPEDFGVLADAIE